MLLESIEIYIRESLPPWWAEQQDSSFEYIPQKATCLTELQNISTKKYDNLDQGYSYPMEMGQINST